MGNEPLSNDVPSDKCAHEAAAERRGLSVEKQHEMRCRTGDDELSVCAFCKRKMDQAADEAADARW